MVIYEPELMYALDSKGEYADWKNVYNVSGSDVLYCPICLGKVKLWNGQNPDKTYKKQRCFHHIDGMCSQESRIHFAYKTWLLEKGSKFKIKDIVYEVKNSEIEKTLHTKFGDYRPDIIVETTNNKKFYIEVADTNKKTDDYIEKWDDLGCDVLELDVNEQLIKATINEIPEFKIIYSSTTGECFIKHYTRQDYDDLITKRKIYWKRKDLLKYKIQWEQLGWFWKKLQDFYLGKSKIESLIEAFKELDPSDQKFVCKRMRGKHLSLKYELENNYTDQNDLESAHLQHISLMIRKLNKEFGYSSCDEFDDTYLFRKGEHIIFKDSDNWENCTHLLVGLNTTEEDVYNYFHSIMKKYYEKHTLPFREKIKQQQKYFEENGKYIKTYLLPCLNNIQRKINRCNNKSWHMTYSIRTYKYHECKIIIELLNHFNSYIYLYFDNENYSFYAENLITTKINCDLYINNLIVKKMNELFDKAKYGDFEIRVMEES